MKGAIFKIFLISWLFLLFLTGSAQEVAPIQFTKISCAEKWWVIKHPFKAKKAKKITKEARAITKKIKTENVLKGVGNGDQIDAFRHTYWMARLTQEIGWRRAKRLGKAHEKGNYRDFKKHRNEDGALPDKISSEMDLYNNTIGIKLGKKSSKLELKEMVVEVILTGKCKIIRTDKQGNYVSCNGETLSKEGLIDKWENEKCLVESDYLN
jgi:Domain of unknown function (DUF6973)